MAVSEGIKGQSSPFLMMDRRSISLRALTAQLGAFLRSQVDEFRPDLIIVHERKGTAILRNFIEEVPEGERLDWSWDRVISSTALNQVDAAYFSGKRILIFDDMMKTGKHIQSVLDYLSEIGEERLDTPVLRAVVFAAHEDAQPIVTSGALVVSTSAFYRGLSSTAYEVLRELIVRMLQLAGSLMLDTEHIEVRLRLKGSFGQLVESLRRSADAVVFSSAGGRKNITVYYGDDPAHCLPPERFPEGVGFTKIVKKCRIVHRTGDEFAIIPICLPSIPERTPWTLLPSDAAMLGAGVEMSSEGRFYGAALLGSLMALRWCVKDLFAGDRSVFALDYPRKSQEVGKSYTLEHLRTMYPTLSVDRLVDEVVHCCQEAATEGRLIRSRQKAARAAWYWTDDELHSSALKLLQLIGATVDYRHAEASLLGETLRDRRGLRASEIFSLGTTLGFEAARISTLFDILIDDANLVTRVEVRPDDAGVRRIWRTFKPDGEVVSDLLRRFSRQWGVPEPIHTYE